MNSRIKLALSKGKIEGAKTLLKEFLVNKDKSDWLEARHAEYYALFPLTEIITVTTVDEFEVATETEEEVAIDYAGVENYLNLTDWLAETKEVFVGTETATDGNGTEYQKEVFETQSVRPYALTVDFTAEIEAYIKSELTPKSVTMRQARIALHRAGLLATVEGAINGSGNAELQIEWEYAVDIRRDWESFIVLSQALGLTETQLDDLFILAGSL